MPRSSASRAIKPFKMLLRYVVRNRSSGPSKSVTSRQLLEFCLAPRPDFEPATNRLTAGCSTAELPGNTAALACKRVAITKPHRL